MHSSPPTSGESGYRAFTLIELLTVVAILGILMTFVVLPMAGINNAGSLTKATADIAGTLEAARAYAMANNTHVWVGFAELDANQLESINPQASGIGRVVVAAVASKDGTRNETASRLDDTNVIAVSAPKKFENVHLGPLTNDIDGGMRRPNVDALYVIDGISSSEIFSWPLTGANPRYKFLETIHFDPSGVARKFKTPDEIGQYFEIYLRPSRGNVRPSNSGADKGNRAAIQVDCMTGAVRIYRP